MTAPSQIPYVDILFQHLRRRDWRGTDLIRRVTNRFVTQTEVTTRNRYGVVFRLRPTDYLDSIVIREGYYESEVLESLLALPESSIVWDVGANFGLHCVTLKVLRPDLRVVAFEPGPDQAARVLANADMNKVSIELVNVGLGRTPEFSTLHTVSGNPGMNTFSPWSGATYTGKVICCVETGDRLVSMGIVPPPYAIKLDIEGYEEAALSGMSNMLKSVSRLVIEGGEEIQTILRGHGFDQITPAARLENSDHDLKNYIAERSD